MTTYLYLLSSTAQISAGTLCRIFGQVNDGRTVVETQTPIEGVGIWDGIQENGIPIGVEASPEPWITKESEIPAIDNDLAKKAVITQAILAASPKLKDNQQVQGQLELLSQAVQQVAGTTATLTDIAVQGIADIMAHPSIQAVPELHAALEQAKDSVVALTDGSVD